MKPALWILVLFLMPGCAFAMDRAFWVWNRAQPPDEKERTLMGNLGIKTLYWQVGELENKTGVWRRKDIRARFPEEDAAVTIVPVIRLETTVAEPFANDEELLQLIEAIRPVSDGLQIDYDCPDRLLGQYADFLKKLRKKIPGLSATALAGWIDLDSFSHLQSAVGELMPMFYDLKPDTLTTLTPLMDFNAVKASIEKWNQRCRIPWRMGLPWFARLTLYDTNGNSLGHIRNWEWDDVCFNQDLVTAAPTIQGMTVLRAEAPTTIGRHALKKGQTLVVRWPDIPALVRATEMCSRIIFFRLPNREPESGWSLYEVGQLDKQSQPRLVLNRTISRRGATLKLVNDSDADLSPRLSGKTPLDRGYELEIDAPFPVFRDVEEGDFWRVTGHKNPDTHPEAVAIPLATRLTFWFSALPAHDRLAIGQFRLAPGTDRHQLRYRLVNVDEATDWAVLP